MYRPYQRVDHAQELAPAVEAVAVQVDAESQSLADTLHDLHLRAQLLIVPTDGKAPHGIVDAPDDLQLRAWQLIAQTDGGASHETVDILHDLPFRTLQLNALTTNRPLFETGHEAHTSMMPEGAKSTHETDSSEA